MINRIKNLFIRVRRYFSLCATDLSNSISWHLLGRKYYYCKNIDEIISDHKWVFVVGCNNSGTSILQRIMEICAPISTLPLEGQRYTKVLPRVMRRGKERVWMEYSDDLMMRGRPDKNEVARLVHDWIRNMNTPVNEIVLEKTPANLLRMAWLDEAFENAYFIGLVRDGFAVVEGINRKSNKSIKRAAVHWQLANNTLKNNSLEIINYLQLTYEDLVQNPDASIAKISEFIGLSDYDSNNIQNVDFGIKTVSTDKIVGLKNLNAKSRSRLSKADYDLIEECAGDMLSYLGYTN